MILKRASFDDAVAAGAEYHPPSRPSELPLAILHTEIQDSPDDFIVLDNAVLTPPVGVAWRGLWLADAIQYMGPAWRTANWLPGRYDVEHDTIDIDEDNLTTDIRYKQPLFYVDSTVGSYNFGHFMYDTAQYSWLFQNVRRMLGNTTIPVIAPLKFSHQQQLFDALFDFPYHDSVLLAIDRPMRVDRLVVPRRQTNLDDPPWRLSFAGVRHIRDAALRRWSRDGNGVAGAEPRDAPDRGSWLELVRSILDGGRKARQFKPRQPDAAPGAPVPAASKVHLYRLQDVEALRRTGNLQGRNFTNIEALAPVLLRKGYLVYEPSLMPLEYLVPSLARADVIVGVHGAGLANFVFAPPGTRVYEITGHNGTWRCLEALSTVLGHKFVEVRQPVPADLGCPHIDLEMLEALP